MTGGPTANPWHGVLSGLRLKKALEKRDRTFSGPKEIGEIRGISYSYSLLWRFGVIRVPADVGRKLMGN